MVVKTVAVFGLVATLGNVLYGSIFLATDILSEVYGKKAARRGRFAQRVAVDTASH